MATKQTKKQPADEPAPPEDRRFFNGNFNAPSAAELAERTRTNTEARDKANKEK